MNAHFFFLLSKVIQSKRSDRIRRHKIYRFWLTCSRYRIAIHIEFHVLRLSTVVAKLYFNLNLSFSLYQFCFLILWIIGGITETGTWWCFVSNEKKKPFQFMQSDFSRFLTAIQPICEHATKKKQLCYHSLISRSKELRHFIGQNIINCSG